MTGPAVHTLAVDAESIEPHRLQYYVWGEGRAEAIIGVHGLTRNAHDFDHLALALQEHFRIACPDMPGRGKSPWLANPAGYNNAAYMHDIEALYTALGVTQADWIGTSMGGILGMMLAAGKPERIRRLVLNDVGAFIPREALLRLGSYVGKDTVFTSRAEAEARLREIYAPFGITEERRWQHMFTHSLEELPDGHVRFAYDPAIGNAFADESKIQDVSLWPVWESITCPVLILRGAHSDILSHETAAQMQMLAPERITYVEIPSVGHAPTLGTPEEIALIRRWLKEE